MKFEIQRKDFKKKYSMSFIRYFLILNFIRTDYPLKFKMHTFKIKDYFLNVKFSSLKLKKKLIQRVILFNEVYSSKFIDYASNFIHCLFQFQTLCFDVRRKNLWSPKIKSVEI